MKDKKAIFPDKNGVLQDRPTDPETGKVMKGYLENHPVRKRGKK
jgi:hypothetical protein